MKHNVTKVYSILLLLVVAGLLFYGYVFWDIWQKNQRIGELSHEISVSEKREDTFRSIEGVLAETEDEREELRGYLVTEDSIVSFLRYIEVLGERVGVAGTIANVSHTDEDGDTTVRPLELTVKAEGTLRGVEQYLSLLQFMPYRVDVEQVRFARTSRSPDEEGGAAELWRADYKFTVLELQV